MSDPTETTKPECKFEITPAMIEAGIFAYVGADEVLETREEIVLRIYRAMRRAKKSGSASGPV